ncbi:hypothetical protein [Methylocystis sp. H62]|uniref:hypothetical protein n=1 Tax=Methylocystis sp. H62 TaxID=2785789 RepID=UPI001FEE826C|nr:hypothetical protein [Methylocystis sp. H62]
MPLLPKFAVVVWIRKTAALPALRDELIGLAADDPDETTEYEEMVDFRDIEAVRNAIVEHWSSGQAEGQINRLKTLKRAMYGRAGIELLRARMLPFETAMCT